LEKNLSEALKKPNSKITKQWAALNELNLKLVDKERFCLLLKSISVHMWMTLFFIVNFPSYHSKPTKEKNTVYAHNVYTLVAK
jgi:hypothetical protein